MKKHLLMVVFASVLANAQAPSGYYNSANGLSGASLKTALSTIITNGHQDKGYNGLWTAYKTTDIDKNYENDGSILDIYSENLWVQILTNLHRLPTNAERIRWKEIAIT
jgi:hypothetical protein